ncbi:MAG: hypothetical protein [Microviridae sp. ctD0m35]|nr:MAG: hypothetical protein [Microviridae sp. ctudC31]QGH72992.1 MAG: hypothetical protein [Microviridae sp. ctD0m35]
MYMLLLIILTVLGCSAISRSIDNYEACVNDPVCYERAKVASQIAAQSAQSAAETSFTIPQMVGTVVGAGAMAITAVWLGRKKRGV